MSSSKQPLGHPGRNGSRHESGCHSGSPQPSFAASGSLFHRRGRARVTELGPPLGTLTPCPFLLQHSAFHRGAL